ncbi:MAG: DUF222 domain-containing protein, partial [Nocardioidaceae bacterium]
MERLVSLGGEGTPEVAEFAPAELATELGISDGAGRHLVADALDLRHRLPGLWAKVTAGDVRVFVARQVAGKTRDLDPTAAAHVDEKTCLYVDTLSWGRLEPVVDAAVIAADPELAQARADEEAQRQGVFTGRGSEHGLNTMFIRAGAADVSSLDAYVDAIADQLGLLGDTDSKDLRRATALGYVCDPDAVWTLFNQPPATQPADADEPASDDPGPTPDHHDAEGDPWDLAHPTNTDHDTDQADPAASPETTRHEPPAGQDQPAPDEPRDDSRIPAAFRRPTPPTIPHPLRSVTLYLHLDPDVFSGLKPGAARYTGEGPITVEQAREILGHANVTIKPVIDLADMTPADAYEVPARLKEAAMLRTPASCFPYASDPDPKVDIDHTIAYQHHPPGDEGGKA